MKSDTNDCKKLRFRQKKRNNVFVENNMFQNMREYLPNIDAKVNIFHSKFKYIILQPSS